MDATCDRHWLLPVWWGQMTKTCHTSMYVFQYHDSDNRCLSCWSDVLNNCLALWCFVPLTNLVQFFSPILSLVQNRVQVRVQSRVQSKVQSKRVQSSPRFITCRPRRRGLSNDWAYVSAFVEIVYTVAGRDLSLSRKMALTLTLHYNQYKVVCTPRLSQ
jgi:hypothetical protein